VVCASAQSQIPALPRSSSGWLQRVRPPEATPGVDLDAMSEAQLERLHAGLVKLAAMDDTVLAALVEHVFGDDELGPSS
jgi:hypothetical protein